MNPQQPNDNNVPPVTPNPAPQMAPQPQDPAAQPATDVAQQPTPEAAQPFAAPAAPVAPSPFDQAPQQPQQQPSQPMAAPSPFGAPAQPGAPAPFPGPQAAMPPQMPKKPMGKGLLFGIIGGVIGLLAIVAVILVATGVFSVTHKDYVAAQEALNAESLDNYRPDVPDDPSVDDVLALRDQGVPVEIDAYLKNLDDLKAFRLDSDLNEKYAAFKDSIAGLDDYLGVNYESAAVTIAIYSDYSADASYVDRANAIISALKDIEGKLKYDANKTYVSGMIAAYEDILPAAKRMDANSNISSYSDYDSGAYTAYRVIYDKTSDLSDAWTTDKEDAVTYDHEAASDAFDALQDAVDAKVKETA